jgi:hypothetical protein
VADGDHPDARTGLLVALSSSGRGADIGRMATLLGWRHLRLAVLLAILAVVIGTALTGAISPTNEAAVGAASPRLTAAQKTAAMNALERIVPPAGFHRYERWRLETSLNSPAVPCISAPAICFGNTTPLRALNESSARVLVAKFGVRPEEFVCDSLPVQASLSTCPGDGSFAGYRVGIVITVVHARFPGQRSGTQVELFVVRPK